MRGRSSSYIHVYIYLPTVLEADTDGSSNTVYKYIQTVGELGMVRSPLAIQHTPYSSKHSQRQTIVRVEPSKG